MAYRLFIVYLSFLTSYTCHAQLMEDPVREIELFTNDSAYSLSGDRVEFRRESHLAFEYWDENQTAEVWVYPNTGYEGTTLELNPTSTYDLTDSIVWIKDHYRFRVRFNKLSENDFLSFIFKFPEHNKISEHKLLPIARSLPEFPPYDSELFIGEEKSFELVGNNPNNIKTTSSWVREQDIHYKLERVKGKVYIHLLPQKTGKQDLDIEIELRKPYRTANGSLSNKLKLPSLNFTVRNARIAFLGLSRDEFIREDSEVTGNIEVELDYHPGLRLNKTYRLEPQEEVGGMLIAEIFTRRTLANGRVLSYLRLYNNHRRTDGYLYIKDGDDIQFITNFDVIPKTRIDEIYLKRDGREWEKTNSIYPGEEIEIRLTGVSMDKGYFHFDGLNNVIKDSVNASSSEVRYYAKISPGIDKRRIEIWNNNESTGKQLRVNEYSEPRNFDYVDIIFAGDTLNLMEAPQVNLVKKSINDVWISFNRELIDKNEYHGPQVLEIEIAIRDAENHLIDTRIIRNIRIKPEGSLRSDMYQERDYMEGYLSINKYIRNRILNLEPWSNIIITVRSSPTFYKDKGFEKTIELALSKPYTFDIEVSFPAGLITVRANSDGEDLASLGGISMAMIAQFSFYKPGKINIKKPYQLGVGFLALNAFNFSQDSERDMAIVGLASLYPIRTGKKFAFPLYLGGGYLISEDDWFVLLGPGIRVSF